MSRLSDFLRKLQIGQRAKLQSIGEQADDGALAVQRGKRAYAELRVGVAGAQPSFLRHVVAIGQKVGQHLEPRHHVRRHAGRKRAQWRQHAVDPPAQFEAVGRGLQMHVAGAALARGSEHELDEPRGIGAVGRIERTQRLSQWIVHAPKSSWGNGG